MRRRPGGEPNAGRRRRYLRSGRGGSDADPGGRDLRGRVRGRTPRTPSTTRKILQPADRTTPPGRSARSTTLRCDAENAVHSQEHGAVWITYQPDLPESDREALAQLAEDQPYLLISPYPGLEDPVVASAWGAQLRLDDVNDPRLQAFIDRYAGNGPERGATCDTGVETTVDEG